MSENNLAVLARVGTKTLTQWPQDLYVPPDALEVLLDSFAGPLDLLLYLIRKQNLDILNIPIAQITAQYLEYLSLLEAQRFELAADYLLMAAWLAEIKSRMLLPRPATADTEEDADPRAELVRRLLEYEQIKRAASALDACPRMERDVLAVRIALPDLECPRPLPDVELSELVHALRDVLTRAELYTHHTISRERLSVRERMGQLLQRLDQVHFSEWHTLLQPEEGRTGVVVTFLALLELVREALVEVVQAHAFAPLYVRLRTAA